MSITLIYVPCKNSLEAKKIARILIDKSLIACANLMPINSIFWWNGNFKEENEVVLLCKTTNKLEKDARNEIKIQHSYDVPAIISWKVDVNKDFEGWIGTETQKLFK
jgi:periplasmic divalent cation tolerance protein